MERDTRGAWVVVAALAVALIIIGAAAIRSADAQAPPPSTTTVHFSTVGRTLPALEEHANAVLDQLDPNVDWHVEFTEVRWSKVFGPPGDVRVALWAADVEATGSA